MNIAVIDNTPRRSSPNGNQLAFPTTWAPDPYAHFEKVLTADVVRALDALPALPKNWRRKHLRMYEQVARDLKYSEHALLEALGRPKGTLQYVRTLLGCSRPRGHHTSYDHGRQGVFALTAAIQIARGTAAPKKDAVAVPRAAPVSSTVRCTIDAALFGQAVTIAVSSKEDIARVMKMLEAAL